MIRKHTILLAFLAAAAIGQAQGILGGHVTGNIAVDGQMSSADATIGAEDVPEKLLLNSRADVFYSNGGFSAGLRFEMYQNPLLGFDSDWKQGQGMANYFVAYSTEKLSVTAGNFYEQFGSGMILRSYEDRYLGIDNSLFGLNVQYRPVAGITVKALAGRQRLYWDYVESLVRGVDAEVNLNSILTPLQESPLHITVGAGFVSKYEDDESIIASANPEYRLNLPLNVGAAAFRLNLPLNVGAAAFRLDMGYGHWGLQAEYARKGQDPSVMNNYIFREGEALTLNLTYSQRGFSTNLQCKHVDNMAFKSLRSREGQMAYINYIPAINKQHTYALLSMYPYATQTVGENGLQADVIYKIKKNTLLGGKYGTDLHLNTSVITSLHTDSLGGRGTEGYHIDWFDNGGIYYGDLSVEVAKKLSPTLKLVATYAYQVFNPVVEEPATTDGLHHNNIVVADLTWKVHKGHSLRFEAEWLGSDSRYDDVNDPRAGDWIMGLVEWNIGSHWFLSASDQYPYNDGSGNYYNVAVGYTHDATRLQIAFGKQRRGMLCIGGVCREVPASNGLTFSLTTNF
ncbi:MAG: hypothetical protein II531_05150 [Bacteroidales bacterium]|nr:hypothetical protein [Bacteroidales bacterium]